MRAKRLREGLDSSDCPLDRLEFDSMSIKLSETTELTNNYYHHGQPNVLNITTVPNNHFIAIEQLQYQISSSLSLRRGKDSTSWIR